MGTSYATEADLVRAFTEKLQQRHNRGGDWTVYHETAGWDLLLVHKDGYQLGVEAKLKLNPKVVDQALSGLGSFWEETGPDYRAVLVPEDGLQNHMSRICRALGLGVIAVGPGTYSLNLPDERGYGMRDWSNWCPSKRCALPEYMPDVEGGKPSPLMLTPWKIKAIKLMIVLEHRGYVTRADMKALQISPTIWCAHGHGYLTKGEHGYVRTTRTPDLAAQHPSVWEQAKADAAEWAPKLGIVLRDERQGELL